MYADVDRRRRCCGRRQHISPPLEMDRLKIVIETFAALQNGGARICNEIGVYCAETNVSITSQNSAMKSRTCPRSLVESRLRLPMAVAAVSVEGEA